VPDIRIDNFAKVNETYFRGGQPRDHDYDDLARLGVKVVINLAGFDAQPDEKAIVERHGMRFVQMPMTNHMPPTPAEIETFLAIVKEPANQPVFVHCIGGRHRTGVMTAIYRMVNDGISGAEAFKEMKRFRYGFDFLHPEFKRFVLHFNPQRRHRM
jgi:protein tyrosine/serine phosphatase